jgi:eukaryotic-like serine/threonine-protein kinase
MTTGDRIGHYTIVSHLGSGGMGAVYRATDVTLGRDVALKILPSAMARDPERLERFQREARAVAALNHPGIVTVHSVENDGGVHFLTMELVDGRPLDDVLAGELLPVERVREIAEALAEALAVAHEKGIVHRDLKPANVILTETGRVKLLDFGLAKMTVPAGGVSSPDDLDTGLATELGVVLGTPAYMSPEQVAGRPTDHRTDIFSLGILLYELATGVRPFRGTSSAELASSILRDRPLPASDMRPQVPAAFTDILSRCLEKDAVARFSRMAEVLSALRQLTAVKAGDTGPSVAVLPFQNLSADPENEFFGDGLAEEVLNALTQVPGLRVAARTSSFSFKGRTVDLAEIGATLRVATVIDGSVRRSGNRIRVTVRLVDVADGAQRWSERYDRELADIFDVQDEIARAIVDKLKVTLTNGDARLVRAVTANIEAYDLYLRGRALLLKRGRHVDEGVTCLRRAVELDPRFAAAWSGLADAYTIRGYWGTAPPGEMMPKGLTAARRAVALDPQLAEGHSALALSLLLWERNFPAANAAFRRCIELSPGYTQGRCWYALFDLLWVSGHSSDAITELRRALDNDPLSAYASTVLGLGLCSAGEYAEALQWARRGAELDPESLITHWVHGLAADSCGQLEESIAALRRAEAVSDSHAYPVASTVVAYANAGRTTDARAEYGRLLSLATRRHVPSTFLAMAAAAVGESDKAFELAHQACDERDPPLIFMARCFPGFQRVRELPGFAEIVRRLDLPAI